MWWHTMTQGRGKWRGNWRMEWVASTLHTTSEHGVSSTNRLPVVDWTDAPADLNGLVRFAERRNLVSARVPSHFNWPLPPSVHSKECMDGPVWSRKFLNCRAVWMSFLGLFTIYESPKATKRNSKNLVALCGKYVTNVTVQNGPTHNNRQKKFDHFCWKQTSRKISYKICSQICG